MEVGSKNRSNIDQKRRSTWEGTLVEIFYRCWWILGGKLGRKIEPRQDKTGHDRARPDKTRLRQDKTGQDRARQAKTRQDRARGTFCARGGGVHPTVRGRPPRGLGPLVPLVGARTFCDFFTILLPFFFSSFFRCHF